MTNSLKFIIPIMEPLFPNIERCRSFRKLLLVFGLWGFSLFDEAFLPNEIGVGEKNEEGRKKVLDSFKSLRLCFTVEIQSRRCEIRP